MNALAKNIRRKLAENNMTQKDLADKANISQVMVHKLVSGKVTATAKIMAISDALGCQPNELVSEYNVSDSLKSSEFVLAQNNIVKVPLISWVRAGMWESIVENFEAGFAEDWIDVPAKISSRSFALTVKGDSMTNPFGLPSMPEGSIVIVDPSIDSYSGRIVVAKLNDSNEATLKKYVKDGSQVYLVPLNPRYPTLNASNDIAIVGVVVSVIQNLL